MDLREDYSDLFTGNSSDKDDDFDTDKAEEHDYGEVVGNIDRGNDNDEDLYS